MPDPYDRNLFIAEQFGLHIIYPRAYSGKWDSMRQSAQIVRPGVLFRAIQIETHKGPTLTHSARCNANYPEKPEGEKPQQIEEIDIGDGEVVYQCVDCGAYEIAKKDV